jgi:Cys/Met metabolism PLP-dependent enzyme
MEGLGCAVKFAGIGWPCDGLNNGRKFIKGLTPGGLCICVKAGLALASPAWFTGRGIGRCIGIPGLNGLKFGLVAAINYRIFYYLKDRLIDSLFLAKNFFSQIMKFNSSCVHAGQEPDQITGAVIPAISLSTTFAQASAGQTRAGYDYSRSGNPTRQAFEIAVATLEGGKHGTLSITKVWHSLPVLLLLLLSLLSSLQDHI